MSDAAPPPGAPPPGPPAERGFLGPWTGLLRYDRRALAILLYVPIALTTLEFVFIPGGEFKRPIPEWAAAHARDFASALGMPRALAPHLWWALGCVLLTLVLPMALLRLVAGTTPRECGLRLKGTLRDAPAYLLLFVVFAPVVWLASRRPEFLATYPFYRPRGSGPLGIDFVVFEVAYCLQFLCVEYFFRGVMVLGLKPRLGRASILVMLAPYCMIHFHKPMLEAFGAIGAGLVLGHLAWRTGTVVYGWFLHYAVALSMDLLALHQAGRL
jgi:uncharacterized protein